MAESAQRRGQRRRIVGQAQTRPVVTSIRPQVRVPVSHMWLLALFGLPAPSEAPPDVRVPAKGRADHAAAWAHGAAGTRAPGDNLT